MSRSYLLTGAAGFLGGTICRQLLARNDGSLVRAFVLPNDPAMQFVPNQVEICEGDLTDKKSLARFFDTPEGLDVIVIHCEPGLQPEGHGRQCGRHKKHHRAVPG